MTTKKLSKQAEDTLMSSVKDLCNAVESGTSPTEAAVKVANDNHYGTEMIKLMCQGYNVGAVNNQREGGGSILTKLSAVPLIDVDAVSSLCFPGRMNTPAQVKSSSVVDICYKQPPRAPVNVATQWQTKQAADLKFKAAEAPAPPPKSVLPQIRELDRAIKTASENVTHTQMQALHHLGKLADYFKQPSAMPIEEFEAVATGKYGEAAVKLSDYICIRNKQPLVKRASVRLPPSSVVWSEVPYSLLDNAIEALQTYKQAAYDRPITILDSRVKAAKLMGPVVSISIKKVSISILPKKQKTETEKKSDAVTNMLTWQLGQAGRENLFGSPDEAKEKGEVSDELMELSDPEHEDQLREVRTQRMLHDLLKNDTVLSGYPPKQVMDAYNDLADFSPRIADKPVMVRSVLRKWLPQGQLDTFEASDLANTEKTLADTGKAKESPALKVSHAKSEARSGVLSPR